MSYQESTDEARVKCQSQKPQENNQIGDYMIGKTLGKGTFGKVKQGIHIITGQKIAIKIIDKQSIEDQDDKCRVNRQVQILRIARHPNIIHLYQIIETTDHIYLMMEYAQKGQLFQLMSNQLRLKQRTAGRIFIQIMNAVQYLHRLGIAHRDLKPQNILLDTDFNIKLIDFGLSNYQKQGKLMKTACGSPCYAPPEMVAGNSYDGCVGDLWSLGIIFYAMICGSLPFQQKTTKQLYQKVIQGFYVIPSDISMSAIQVITRMLKTNPSQRITIPQLRQLKFFSDLKDIEPQIIGIIVGYHPMPIDNQIMQMMKSLVPINITDVQQDIKQNRHNKATTTYYLLQKKTLREGGRTIVDLQVFLQTHEKYKRQYGRESLQKKKSTTKVSRSHHKISKDQLKITQKKTPTKTQTVFSNDKIKKRFHTMSDQKQPSNRFSTRKQKNQLKTSRDHFSPSKTINVKKSKPSKINNINLAKGIWQAYFENPIQAKSKDKKVTKKLNPKQKQKLNAFNSNIKKLKQGFLRLPNMKR